MNKNLYFARQAIVDNDESIMGYELLYRDDKGKTNIDNPRHATASLLVNVLNQFGLNNIVGEQLAFINIEESFLRHNFIESIPPSTFVFELTASSDLDEKLVENIQRLHNKKYIFSIDIDSCDKINIIKTLFPYLTFVKIDTRAFEVENLVTLITELKKNSIIVIATKVEDVDTFELYQKAGCNAYQGYFFANPKILKDKKIDAKQSTIFSLCNTIQSGSTIPEISNAFESSPEINMQLLQFINSAAFHFRAPISSIHQIVTLLGRNALVQWLMLMLYSKNFSSDIKFQNPLFIMVKQRTLIMVNLIKLIKKDATQKDQSEAYFVGALSLIDALLQVPLEEVLSTFYIDQKVKEALFYRYGILGELYAVSIAVEEFNPNVIEIFLNKYKIEKSKFDKIILEVFKEAISDKDFNN